jgi:DNA-binding LacI/PurR family transcriptional regulator
MTPASPSGRPTSSDVAREAGVSRATVSYVLNDAKGQTIPEHTRRAVHEAAARLGYQPNLAARSLKTGRSQLIVFAVPRFTLPGIEHVLGQLTGRLAESGVAVVAHFESEFGPGLVPLTRLLRPSAVLSIGPLEAAESEALATQGVNVVHASAPRGLGTVNASFGPLQVAHLAGHGHTRLAFAQSADPSLAPLADVRCETVLEACRALQLPPPPVEAFELDGTGASEIVARWHADGITAVCAYNDEVAYAVLRGIRLAGLRCPDDLAVVGVDDMRFNVVSEPPLTSVGWDVEGAVALLTRMLLESLGLSDGTPETPVASRVYERESTTRRLLQQPAALLD